MLRRIALVGALTVALSGVAAIPAFAQGKHTGQQKAHVAKVNKQNPGKHGQGNNGQEKGKSNRANASGHNWNWTAEQRARYAPVLPAGMTLEQAGAGFATQGQFISALNAAREHHVSFLQLRVLMIDRGMSLGEALRTLRP